MGSLNNIEDGQYIEIERCKDEEGSWLTTENICNRNYEKYLAYNENPDKTEIDNLGKYLFIYSEKGEFIKKLCEDKEEAIIIKGVTYRSEDQNFIIEVNKNSIQAIYLGASKEMLELNLDVSYEEYRRLIGIEDTFKMVGNIPEDLNVECFLYGNNELGIFKDRTTKKYPYFNTTGYDTLNNSTKDELRMDLAETDVRIYDYFTGEPLEDISKKLEIMCDENGITHITSKGENEIKYYLVSMNQGSIENNCGMYLEVDTVEIKLEIEDRMHNIIGAVGEGAFITANTEIGDQNGWLTKDGVQNIDESLERVYFNKSTKFTKSDQGEYIYLYDEKQNYIGSLTKGGTLLNENNSLELAMDLEGITTMKVFDKIEENYRLGSGKEVIEMTFDVIHSILLPLYTVKGSLPKNKALNNYIHAQLEEVDETTSRWISTTLKRSPGFKSNGYPTVLNKDTCLVIGGKKEKIVDVYIDGEEYQYIGTLDKTNTGEEIVDKDVKFYVNNNNIALEVSGASKKDYIFVSREENGNSLGGTKIEIDVEELEFPRIEKEHKVRGSLNKVDDGQYIEIKRKLEDLSSWETIEGIQNRSYDKYLAHNKNPEKTIIDNSGNYLFLYDEDETFLGYIYENIDEEKSHNGIIYKSQDGNFKIKIIKGIEDKVYIGVSDKMLLLDVKTLYEGERELVGNEDTFKMKGEIPKDKGVEAYLHANNLNKRRKKHLNPNNLFILNEELTNFSDKTLKKYPWFTSTGYKTKNKSSRLSKKIGESSKGNKIYDGITGEFLSDIDISNNYEDNGILFEYGLVDNELNVTAKQEQARTYYVLPIESKRGLFIDVEVIELDFPITYSTHKVMGSLNKTYDGQYIEVRREFDNFGYWNTTSGIKNRNLQSYLAYNENPMKTIMENDGKYLFIYDEGGELLGKLSESVEGEIEIESITYKSIGGDYVIDIESSTETKVYLGASKEMLELDVSLKYETQRILNGDEQIHKMSGILPSDINVEAYLYTDNKITTNELRDRTQEEHPWFNSTGYITENTSPSIGTEFDNDLDTDKLLIFSETGELLSELENTSEYDDGAVLFYYKNIDQRIAITVKKGHEEKYYLVKTKDDLEIGKKGIWVEVQSSEVGLINQEKVHYIKGQVNPNGYIQTQNVGDEWVTEVKIKDSDPNYLETNNSTEVSTGEQGSHLFIYDENMKFIERMDSKNSELKKDGVVIKRLNNDIDILTYQGSSDRYYLGSGKEVVEFDISVERAIEIPTEVYSICGDVASDESLNSYLGALMNTGRVWLMDNIDIDSGYPLKSKSDKLLELGEEERNPLSIIISDPNGKVLKNLDQGTWVDANGVEFSLNENGQVKVRKETKANYIITLVNNEVIESFYLDIDVKSVSLNPNGVHRLHGSTSKDGMMVMNTEVNKWVVGEIENSDVNYLHYIKFPEEETNTTVNSTVSIYDKNKKFIVRVFDGMEEKVLGLTVVNQDGIIYIKAPQNTNNKIIIGSGYESIFAYLNVGAAREKSNITYNIAGSVANDINVGTHLGAKMNTSEVERDDRIDIDSGYNLQSNSSELMRFSDIDNSTERMRIYDKDGSFLKEIFSEESWIDKGTHVKFKIENSKGYILVMKKTDVEYNIESLTMDEIGGAVNIEANVVEAELEHHSTHPIKGIAGGTSILTVEEDEYAGDKIWQTIGIENEDPDYSNSMEEENWMSMTVIRETITVYEQLDTKETKFLCRIEKGMVVEEEKIKIDNTLANIKIGAYGGAEKNIIVGSGSGSGSGSEAVLFKISVEESEKLSK